MILGRYREYCFAPVRRVGQDILRCEFNLSGVTVATCPRRVLSERNKCSFRVKSDRFLMKIYTSGEVNKSSLAGEHRC